MTELQKFVSPTLPQRGPLPTENFESQTIGPLSIESGVWRDECDEELLAVEATSESANPIRGYRLTTLP